MSFVLNVEFTIINCGECGGSYAINERYRAHQESKGGSWTCPYCKVGWGYEKAHKSKLERLQAEVAAQIAAKMEAIERVEALEKQLARKSRRRVKS